MHKSHPSTIISTNELGGEYEERKNQKWNKSFEIYQGNCINSKQTGVDINN